MRLRCLLTVMDPTKWGSKMSDEKEEISYALLRHRQNSVKILFCVANKSRIPCTTLSFRLSSSLIIGERVIPAIVQTGLRKEPLDWSRHQVHYCAYYWRGSTVCGPCFVAFGNTNM